MQIQYNPSRRDAQRADAQYELQELRLSRAHSFHPGAERSEEPA